MDPDDLPESFGQGRSRSGGQHDGGCCPHLPEPGPFIFLDELAPCLSVSVQRSSLFLEVEEVILVPYQRPLDDHLPLAGGVVPPVHGDHQLVQEHSHLLPGKR